MRKSSKYGMCVGEICNGNLNIPSNDVFLALFREVPGSFNEKANTAQVIPYRKVFIEELRQGVFIIDELKKEKRDF